MGACFIVISTKLQKTSFKISNVTKHQFQKPSKSNLYYSVDATLNFFRLTTCNFLETTLHELLCVIFNSYPQLCFTIFTWIISVPVSYSSTAIMRTLMYNNCSTKVSKRFFECRQFAETMDTDSQRQRKAELFCCLGA
jgi:hypothetical protein